MLISFVRVGETGHLKASFQRAGMAVPQVRLDLNRPDTSKFDAILGMVSLEATELSERLRLVSDCLVRNGVTKEVAKVVLDYY